MCRCGVEGEGMVVAGDLPVTAATPQWRVDTAQRIVQHVPVAYR
jgi:hypothetical protein